MKISVCIPMYNESRIIEDSVKTLYGYMEANFPGEYEIVIASDGSTDGCAAAVRSLGYGTVKVIEYTPNRGKGYAVRTALQAATGDIAMFMDADLAYGTDVIKQFCNAADANPAAMMVIGSRNIPGGGYDTYPLLRKIASKIYIKILCIFGGLKLSDSQCGCKAFRKEAVKAICPRCEVDRFAFDFEMILWAQKLGYIVHEEPVSVKVFGESKVRIVRDSLKMIRDLVKMRKRIKNTDIIWN